MTIAQLSIYLTASDVLSVFSPNLFFVIQALISTIDTAAKVANKTEMRPKHMLGAQGKRGHFTVRDMLFEIDAHSLFSGHLGNGNESAARQLFSATIWPSLYPRCDCLKLETNGTIAVFRKFSKSIEI